MKASWRRSKGSWAPAHPACPSPTRERVLEVACALFAEAGFHGTHLREVCKRAGANVAGVCYHFHSKEGLYEAVIMEAGRQISRPADQGHGGPSDAAPEQKLRTIIESLFQRLGGDQMWIAKLLARELVDPVCGAAVFAGSGLQRDFIELEGAMRELLGAGADQGLVRLHALSVVSECLFYSLAGENLHRAWPEIIRPLPARSQLAQHVAQRCLGALEREKGQPRCSST